MLSEEAKGELLACLFCSVPGAAEDEDLFGGPAPMSVRPLAGAWVFRSRSQGQPDLVIVVQVWWNGWAMHADGSDNGYSGCTGPRIDLLAGGLLEPSRASATQSSQRAQSQKPV